MPGPEPLPVRIRGVDYPSAKAAAEALGVSREWVYNALCRGRIDRVGLGKGGDYGTAKINAKPVRVGGMKFDSMAALARFIGLKDRSVRRAIMEGGTRSREDLSRRVMKVIADNEAKARREYYERGK